MSGEEYILTADNLSRSFGGFMAVKGVNLKVRRGTIHALIGPNGAGKTTCFNLLTRFLDPTSGTIRYKGQDITAMRPDRLAQRGLVRSFQISAVFPDMTVKENVRLALQLRERGQSLDFWRSDKVLRVLEEEAETLLDEVALNEYRDTRAGELPYGRKRGLEIATTLAMKPDVLLLDEPMAGMGHEDIARTARLIRRIAEGRTVLMVEHNLSVVAELSDVISVLARGEVLAEGSYDEISRNEAVVSAYIGTSHD